MNKKILIAVGVTVFLLLGTIQTKAAAESLSQQLKDQVQNLQQKTENAVSQISDQISQKWEDKCKIIDSRMDIRIARFENNQNRHNEAYKRLRDQLDALISDLNSQNKDTTKLSVDLTELDNKISKFQTDFSLFIVKLREAKNYLCAQPSDGQFRSTMKEAKDLLLVVQQDVLDIRLYYQTVIRPDLQTVIEQLPPIVTATPTL